MSIESVRAFFAEKAPDIPVIESRMSSATVVLAAEAYGVEPARIAKTLSLRIGERVVLIVTSGTSRMDNKKVKALFGGKPKMLGLHEVAEITGHEVGGVCPFGLKTPLPVYCDESSKAFDVVVPAAGSTHSAVKITPARLAELTSAEWVDVCEHPPARSAGLFVVIIMRLGLDRLRLYGLRGTSTRHGLRLYGSGLCCAWRSLRRLGGGALFEHRAATARKLRLILPQTRHDPVHIRHLIAAKAPDIGRAGHPLFQSSAIFFRESRILDGDAAADR